MEHSKFAGDFYSAWSRGTALYVKWSAIHGISYTELSVLYALATKGNTTQKAICEFNGLPKQSVHNCIRQLERDKYICLYKNANDKREKVVLLTDSGQDYAQNILAPLFKTEEYICRNISSEKFIQAIETRELYNTLFEKEMERNV